MPKEYRSADDVLKEKYEERGWNQENNQILKKREEIESLPLTEEEYRQFSFLLAKLILKDKNYNICETYFEIQRRAHYGNRYFPIDDLAEIEEELWNMQPSEEQSNGKKIL